QRSGRAEGVPYSVVVIVVRLAGLPERVLMGAINRHQHGVIHRGVDLPHLRWRCALQVNRLQLLLPLRKGAATRGIQIERRHLRRQISAGLVDAYERDANLHVDRLTSRGAEVEDRAQRCLGGYGRVFSRGNGAARPCARGVDRSVRYQVEVDAVLSATIPSPTVSANASDLMRRDDVDLATIEMLIFPSLVVAAAEAVFNVDGEVCIVRGRKSIAMAARVPRGRHLGPHTVTGQRCGVVSG